MLTVTSKISKSSNEIKTNEKILQEDKDHGLYIIDERGMITETRVTIDPSILKVGVRCLEINNTLNVEFELLLKLQQSSYMVYSASDLEFPRSLGMGDYFRFVGKFGVELYSKSISLPADVSVCKSLNLLDNSPSEEIFALINKGENSFFAQIKDDLKENSLFLGLFEYPFEDIGPKEIEEMNSEENLQLDKYVFSKLDYYTEEKNVLFKHEDSGAQVMIDKMNEVSSLIKQSCIERQEIEGSNYF
jgi:hypothetical protein